LPLANAARERLRQSNRTLLERIEMSEKNVEPTPQVEFRIVPETGYEFKANGATKTYPITSGLARTFERNVASELGVKPQEVIAAIHKAGGLRPELGDEWSYGAEIYSDTAKARSSIQSTLRLSLREMDSRLKYQHVSIIAYQHLHTNGSYYYDPVRRDPYWFDAESKVLFRTESEDFKAHLSTRLQLSREDTAFKHIVSWILDRTIKYAQRVEPRRLSYYDPVKKVLYFNHKPGRVIALDGEKITEEDNGQHALFLWDTDWEPSNPTFDATSKYSLSNTVFGRLMLDETETALTSQEAELLNERWLLSILFRSIIPDRPILALVAEPGSCKTTFAMLPGLTLFGKRFSVLGCEDAKEDAVIAYVTSSPFGVIDNADQANRWLPDLLARTSTGMQMPKRKLYTTNDLVKFLVDCMLVITARMTPWARTDVIQRLILYRVKAPKKYVDRETLQRQVLDNRDYLLGELLQKANHAVKKLRQTESPVDAPWRMAAFYRFSIATVSENGQGLLKSAFEKIIGNQAQLELEQEENLLTILCKWLQNADVALDEDEHETDLWKQTLWTPPLAVSELYGRLAKTAKDEGFRFGISSSLSLGHRLRELRPTLRTSDIPFRKNKGSKGVRWQFGRRPQPAPNDGSKKRLLENPSQPSHPSQNNKTTLEKDPLNREGLGVGLDSSPSQNPSPEIEKEGEGVKDVKDVSPKVSMNNPSHFKPPENSSFSSEGSPKIDERFESVELRHPHIKRGLHPIKPDDLEITAQGTQIVEPNKITEQSPLGNVDSDVGDWEEPSAQTNDVEGIRKPATFPETNNSTDSNRAIHRDRPLHEDYVLRTILPVEETQIGYATLERLSYTLRTRFPDLPKSEVLELLARLEEKRLIEQKPFPRCWRRTKK